jgi:hypothetical protein
MQTRPTTYGRSASHVTKRKLSLTDKQRAVCGESRMHGSEGGVRKHDPETIYVSQCALLLPYLLNVSLGDARIVDAIHRSEIPPDLEELIRGVESFRTSQA